MGKFPNTILYIFVEWTKHLSEQGDNGLAVMSEGLTTSFPDAELTEGTASVNELSTKISENADFNKIYKQKDVEPSDTVFTK